MTDDIGNEAFGARPYLMAGRRADAAAEPVGDGTVDEGVRPYFLTGGRTQSANTEVGFETMVSVTDDGRRPGTARSDVERQILDLTQMPLSVAEVAAHLHLPIGVAQVLSGDLADAGLLQAHHAPKDPSQDRALLEQLVLAVQTKQKEG